MFTFTLTACRAGSDSEEWMGVYRSMDDLLGDLQEWKLNGWHSFTIRANNEAGEQL